MTSSQTPMADHGQPAVLDPSSARLQILATEHWSLLASRQLTYTEALSRVSMFLAVLSGAVIALALLAQVTSLHQTFSLIAILILSVVMFVGVATVGRLAALNREDGRWVMAMNRVRRGYLEMHPELEPYFTTGSHDDARGIMVTMGMTAPIGRPKLSDAAHGFQTLPAMVGVIVSVVAGVWAALIIATFGLATAVALIVGVVAFVLGTLGMWVASRRNFVKFVAELRPAFPSEPTPPVAAHDSGTARREQGDKEI
jgi:hypothetical protein